MKSASPATGIVLVDDGELEDVARVLEAGGLAFDRYRGGQIPKHIDAPRELLIVTSRRLEHVVSKRKSTGHSGEPLRIVAVSEDSPALRRRLRRQGMNLLVRLPANRETWRLLIARALYQGEERRDDTRIATEVAIEAEQSDAILVDLSNRGCRIQTGSALAVGDAIQFTIPGASLPDGMTEPLALAGRVRRVAQLAGSQRRTCAVVFDANLARATRQRLTAVINHWASGHTATTSDPRLAGAAIPSCRLPSLPDLMLDDETDPPVRAGDHAGHDVEIDLLETASRPEHGDDSRNPGNRRGAPRGHFPTVLRANREDRPLALVGRDLSARGMRIERHPELVLGDRFRLALHGPTLARPLTLDATVVRDDAEQGLALAFIGVARETAASLEKIVACLPDVESLEDGELAGLGTVLSEIMRG